VAEPGVDRSRSQLGHAVADEHDHPSDDQHHPEQYDEHHCCPSAGFGGPDRYDRRAHRFADVGFRRGRLRVGQFGPGIRRQWDGRLERRPLRLGFGRLRFRQLGLRFRQLGLRFGRLRLRFGHLRLGRLRRRFGRLRLRFGHLRLGRLRLRFGRLRLRFR
jgi:hypothetical protein